MTTHKVYLVTGKRQYRWHAPGARPFEAKLDPLAEQRAVERGSIQVLEVIESALENGSYELPDDWPRPAADEPHTEAPRGASFVSEGGKK